MTMTLVVENTKSYLISSVYLTRTTEKERTRCFGKYNLVPACTEHTKCKMPTLTYVHM